MSNPISELFNVGICALKRKFLMPYEISDIVSRIDNLNTCLIALLPQQADQVIPAMQPVKKGKRSKAKPTVDQHQQVMAFLQKADQTQQDKSDDAASQEEESEELSTSALSVSQILMSTLKKLKKDHPALDALSATEIFQLVAGWQRTLHRDKYVKTLGYNLGLLATTVIGAAAGYGVGASLIPTLYTLVVKTWFPKVVEIAPLWVGIVGGLVFMLLLGLLVHRFFVNKEETKNEKNLRLQADLRNVRSSLSTVEEMWQQMIHAQNNSDQGQEYAEDNPVFNPDEFICIINNLPKGDLHCLKDAQSPQDLQKRQGLSRRGAGARGKKLGPLFDDAAARQQEGDGNFDEQLHGTSVGFQKAVLTKLDAIHARLDRLETDKVTYDVNGDNLGM